MPQAKSGDGERDLPPPPLDICCDRTGVDCHWRDSSKLCGAPGGGRAVDDPRWLDATTTDPLFDKCTTSRLCATLNSAKMPTSATTPATAVVVETLPPPLPP
jgi:hypothetical protein